MTSLAAFRILAGASLVMRTVHEGWKKLGFSRRECLSSVAAISAESG
jgi:hypothetical protein